MKKIIPLQIQLPLLGLKFPAFEEDLFKPVLVSDGSPFKLKSPLALDDAVNPLV
jgi:hypothetical protein